MARDPASERMRAEADISVHRSFGLAEPPAAALPGF
jgi:hypothetical protein